MIDSIFIASSGLTGHQKGLRVISNNVANMNTPGFKGSTVDFGDVVSASDPAHRSQADAGGQGLVTAQTLTDLRAGERRTTGRDLDLALQGDGFFVLQDEQGRTRYTRAGAFEFNSDGLLVARGNGLTVMGRSATGALQKLSLEGLRANPPKATATVTLTGNLSSDGNEHTVNGLVVFDPQGGTHNLRLVLNKDAIAADGSWNVKVFEGDTEVATAKLRTSAGRVVEEDAALEIELKLKGTEPLKVQFKSGSEVTSFASGSLSTLGVKQQDGHALGQVSTIKFNDRGQLLIDYSNGQKATGAKLALAQVRDESKLDALGDALFAYTGPDEPILREGAEDLKVSGGALELSNVDLTEEFSALILMQRGFQASSQVLSAANGMLQELFEMKGRR
jgi:flagellar hook protein FlgE